MSLSQSHGGALLAVLMTASACGDPPPPLGCDPAGLTGPACIVECLDGDLRLGATECGVNDRGGLLETCIAGRWTETDECFDDDECVDGETKLLPCGEPGTSLEESWTCNAGYWVGVSDCAASPRILEFSATRALTVLGEQIAIHAVTADVESCVLATDGMTVVSEASLPHAYHYRVRIDAAARATIFCESVGRTVSATLVVDVADAMWGTVSAGRHVCAIDHVGDLYCWGPGDTGALGVGDREGRPTPTRVATYSTDWSHVSARDAHTCAVKKNGSLFCWGTDQNGSLGIAQATNAALTPRPVGSDLDWTSVSVGSAYSCAIKSNGRLFCWGANHFGQLGIGTTESVAIPTQEATQSSEWLAVATGHEHTCGLKVDGRLFCWGKNSEGQIGDNTQTHRSSPTLVAGEFDDWTSVGVTDGRTCATRANGDLLCWGRLKFGSIASYADATSPTLLDIFLGSWRNVVVGRAGICAQQADGPVACWSDIDFANFPHPMVAPTTGPAFAQVAVGDEIICGLDDVGQIVCAGDTARYPQPPNEVHTPTQEASLGSTWTDVSASADYSCAIRDGTEIGCWGSVVGGLVSHSELDDEPGLHRRLRRWRSVHTARDYACALDEAGTLRCWGSYFADQGPTASEVPVVVGGGRSDWTQVALGVRHTCAVTELGQIFCWGENGGAIGDGTLVDRPLPAQEVTQAQDWVSVSASEVATCATKSDGRMFCWGGYHFGLLPFWPFAVTPEPMQEVSMANDWASVSLSSECGMVLNTDGRPFAWGGELPCFPYPGLGPNDWWRPGEFTWFNFDGPSAVPVRISQIVRGEINSCALTAYGEVWCWGDNDVGQLGVGHHDLLGSRFWREGTGVRSFKAVSVGDRHVCALKVDGRIACWGDNTHGQLTRDTSVRPIAPIGERTFPPLPPSP